ncbi:MAG: efflux RND transporter periplasmic adaptor subunit [Anaerolineales bacterium]|nr:efflux RND transporter periplasmic adaptor subunit [Anaerolineales bacterium]MCZ2122148.1 efflux RND transporter periplasmic adaptor subunit [Anaerolineales bacterium]
MKKFFAKFSRKTWIVVGVIGVIVIAALFAVFNQGEAPETYQTAKAERGDLAAVVGATGTVRAKQSAVLTWSTTGTVGAVNAEVGQQIARGDILASLDKQSLNQSVIMAEADLVTAQKALEDLLDSDTARAQAARDLDAAEDAYEKAYNYRKGLNGKITITETYLDHGVPKVRYVKGYADAETIKDADQKLALAEAKLNDAKRAYERVKDGADPAEVAAAEARVAAAKATLAQALIVAPFSGVVTQAFPFVGDQVNAGTTAFRVDDLSNLLVDVQVSEVDINTISVGQAATLTFDAIIGKTYEGEVVQVGQAGDTVQGVVNFTVTVQITNADEAVKPGMTAAVNIVVNEVKDVILIPNRAVRLVNGERVVYLLVNGQPVQVKVELGASSDTQSVLTKGDIKAGDPIILNPPTMNMLMFGG